jgi:hypothetical protein
MAQRSLRTPAELAPSTVLRPAVPCSSLHMPIHPPVWQLAPVWLLFWICRRCILWRLRHFIRLHEVSSWYLRRASPRLVACGCVWGCGVIPCLPLHYGSWSMEHPWGGGALSRSSPTAVRVGSGKKERLAMFPILLHLLIFFVCRPRSSPNNECSWI